MANETMVSTNRAANGSGVSAESAGRLKAIREIKNSVIGNRFKKLQMLHVLPELHNLVSSSSDGELLVQALAAIGSIAYGVENGVKVIVECNVVDSLVHALTQDEPRVVVAAARSLKLVYQSHLAPREPLLQQQALQRLISLTHQTYAQVDEVAAQLLGLACSTEAQAEALVSAGAVPALLQLLMSSHVTGQEAAVAALLPITRYSRLACQQVFEFLPSSTADSVSTQQQQQQQHLTATSDSPESPLLQGHQQQYGNQQQQQYAPALRRILQLMKQHDSRMRYLCACCVSNISRVGDSMDPVLQEQVSEACRCAVPYVVRLLSSTEAAACSSSDSGGQTRPSKSSYNTGNRYLYQVPLVLSTLICNRPQLLKLAVELDTIQTLIKLLHSKAATAAIAYDKPQPAAAAAVTDSSSSAHDPVSFTTPAAAAKAARLDAAAAAAAAAAEDAKIMRKGSLSCLAALAMQGDAARQKMLEGGRLVTVIVSSLNDSDAEAKVAAVGCLRGLSRSVKMLRGTIIPSSVAGPLVTMLQDSQATDVQVAAAAAVCNLVLGFSHVRPSLIKAGVIPALSPLITSVVPELRLHAVWAFKNLAHECENEVQGLLLSELTWQGFRDLVISDDDVRVRQQAVGLLQNISCKGAESIDRLLAWSEGGLLPLLEDRLNPAHHALLLQPQPPPQPTAATAGSVTPVQDHKAQLYSLLYAASNVCSGSEVHKTAVMSSAIPHLLLHYLRISSSSCCPDPAVAPGSGVQHAGQAGYSMWDVQTAAVWCIINLLWCDPAAEVGSTATSTSQDNTQAVAGTAAAAARAAVLKDLGCEDALKGILALCAAAGTTGSSSANVAPLLLPVCDGCRQDLEERVQTALQLMQKLAAK